MKKRDMRLYLNDIRESIAAVEEYTKGATEEDFCRNRQVQDAVIRRLEIIGEAAKNIDDDTREKHPEIPWKRIAGLRDIIAHEYFGVKFERIWEVVVKDLPDLKKKLSKMKEECG